MCDIDSDILETCQHTCISFLYLIMMMLKGCTCQWKSRKNKKRKTCLTFNRALTSAREVMFIIEYLFICKQGGYDKKYLWIFTKLGGRMWNLSGKNPVDFGWDPGYLFFTFVVLFSEHSISYSAWWKLSDMLRWLVFMSVCNLGLIQIKKSVSSEFKCGFIEGLLDLGGGTDSTEWILVFFL